MRSPQQTLTWLNPGDAFPDPKQAWGPQTPAPGLVAAGGALDAPTLHCAYQKGIFPWFGPQDPPLWWCPDPRMVLRPAQFRMRRSLRQALRRFQCNATCSIQVDSAFEQVIGACAATERRGQQGTWIVPEMIQAYVALHRQGLAHSIETWVEGELVGGLYLVAMGRAVFGESMFMRRTDASKIALAALVAMCLAHDVPLIDCQQNTRHLASLGAAEISRAEFLAEVTHAQQLDPLPWRFDPIYWNAYLSP